MWSHCVYVKVYSKEEKKERGWGVEGTKENTLKYTYNYRDRLTAKVGLTVENTLKLNVNTRKLGKCTSHES